MRIITLISLCLLFAGPQVVYAAKGELEIAVVDLKSGQPLAGRMTLINSRGNRQRVAGVPNLGNHFSFVGNILLELPPGEYQFFLDCGPEYRELTGYFTLKSGDLDNKKLEMVRFADMAKEGWYCGDLHVSRSINNLENEMMAEQLDLALNISWDNALNPFAGQPISNTWHKFDQQRMVDTLSGTDHRAGGQLIFGGLDSPLAVQKLDVEYPSPLLFERDIKRSQNSLVIAATPWEWDLPTWIAHDLIDAVNVANSTDVRFEELSIAEQKGTAPEKKIEGKPRDELLYPEHRGLARFGQDIYFHLLNCGLRIPPAAGSGSGINPNPVGYQRAYVFCGNNFNPQTWIENLKQGQVVITNGPLLRPSVEGELPGHLFQYPAGRVKEFKIGLNLATREKINYLEVIKNGKVELEVSMEEYAKRQGTLPPLVFKQSGWFLIRAVTNSPSNYRFAMTGPYYVQIGEEKRISKKSALFFYDWIFDRLAQIKIENEKQRQEIMAIHRETRDFWNEIYKKSNAP